MFQCKTNSQTPIQREEDCHAIVAPDPIPSLFAVQNNNMGR